MSRLKVKIAVNSMWW